MTHKIHIGHRKRYQHNRLFLKCSIMRLIYWFNGAEFNLDLPLKFIVIKHVKRLSSRYYLYSYRFSEQEYTEHLEAILSLLYLFLLLSLLQSALLKWAAFYCSSGWVIGVLISPVTMVKKKNKKRPSASQTPFKILSSYAHNINTIKVLQIDIDIKWLIYTLTTHPVETAHFI